MKMTMKLHLTAVALTFNDSLHYHPTLVNIIENYFNAGTFPSPAYKMAHVSDVIQMVKYINGEVSIVRSYVNVVMNLVEN